MSQVSNYIHALDSISPDCNRDIWIKVGMALHHETDGSPEGLEIWREWSSGSDKYDAADTTRQWRSFKHGGGITGGTLIALAKEHGYRNGHANGHSHNHRLSMPKVEAYELKPVPEQEPRRVVARYDYIGADGQLFGTKLRAEPKGFRWDSGRQDGNCPPYGLSRLLEHNEEPVWVVEGEKDADTLNTEGLVAISIETGHEEHAATFLRYRDVHIIPDNDEQGRKRARAVLDAACAVARSARIVDLPGLSEKGDVSDWLWAGNKISHLLQIAEDAQIAHQNATLSAAFTMFDDITLNIDPEFLVDEVIPKTGIGWLYAAPGLGKSFVIQDLCASVARGVPFAGKYDVEQGGVVLIALEAPEGVKKRLYAYGQETRVNSMPLAVLNYPLDICSTESVAQLISLLDEFKAKTQMHTRLVVIDTLAKAMPGADENSSRDMSLAIAGLQSIQTATGSFVMAVHHSGKNDARGGRGHSSGEGAMDCELVLNGKKSDKIRDLHLRKLKDGEDDKTVASFEMRQVKLGVNRKGKEITSAIVRWLGNHQTKKAIELTPPQKAMLNHIDQLILNNQYEVTKDADGVPADKKAVHLKDLIQRCLKGVDVTTALKPHTRRVAINKLIGKLNQRGVLGVFDEKVWIIRRK